MLSHSTLGQNQRGALVHLFKDPHIITTMGVHGSCRVKLGKLIKCVIQCVPTAMCPVAGWLSDVSTLQQTVVASQAMGVPS